MKNDIYTKIDTLRDEMLKDKGNDLRLVCLLLRTDVESKWDLLISADWIKENFSEEEMVYVISKLKNIFDNDLDFLSQIVLLVPQEMFVHEILFSLERGIQISKELEDVKLTSNTILKQVYISFADVKEEKKPKESTSISPQVDGLLFN